MSRTEFGRWIDFYRDHPFDDLHRFHRPAALISASMGNGDIQQRLEWLRPPPAHGPYSVADLNTFKALGIKPPGG